MHRAFALTVSVYGWAKTARLQRIFDNINIAGKTLSILLPLVETGLLELPAAQKSVAGYIILCNFLCSCFYPH